MIGLAVTSDLLHVLVPQGSRIHPEQLRSGNYWLPSLNGEQFFDL
jgi:hypothetical protein